MKNSKRIISLILIFTFIVSFLVWECPVKSEAATSYDTTRGTFVINSLQNEYVDGMYRIRYKFEYKNAPLGVDRITLKKIRLEDSSGNQVKAWKDMEILEGGGSTSKYFAVDFSKLKSDTYYFKYTVEPYYAPEKAKSFQRKIEHSAGSITYTKSNYQTDTQGNMKLCVYFNVKMLNGKTPKLEIYDSNNKLVSTLNSKQAINSNNCNWYWKWGMTYSSTGLPISPGTYSFKMTCGGKSCVKKLNIN